MLWSKFGRFRGIVLFSWKVINFLRAYLVLYKSPVWKKNYQNLVKTTSFERYFSKRDASSFFGRGRGKSLNLQGQNLFRGCPLPPSPNGRKPGCLVSLTEIPSISQKFCKFWPKFQENHSKSCKIQEFLPQELESSGFGILHKLLLSFFEILKFLGTQFSVVHRRWIFFGTPNTR